MQDIKSITLAAGNGTRMKSSTPKPLHKIAGISILDLSCKCLEGLSKEKILIGSDDLIKCDPSLSNKFTVVIQENKLGTGHAVLQCMDKIQDNINIIINYGDTPFVKPETIQKMIEKLQNFDCIFLGFDVSDITQKYGRFIVYPEHTTGYNRLIDIVEYKDADENIKKTSLCNSGIVVVKSEILKKSIMKVTNNNIAKEYYLTDIVKIINASGGQCGYIKCHEFEVMGVNSRIDLSDAENYYQKILRNKHMENGVTLLNPKSVYFSHDTVIKGDVVIEDNIHFGLGVTVQGGTLIKSFSYLENCKIGNNCIIGPFARIRPNTELQNNVHIGNFVEVKNSQINEGTKINHLSYIGDAKIGETTNIGAGTITANYDGFEKHQTIIGKNVSIGAGTLIVAPSKIGDGAMTAAGSVVTAKEVQENSLCISRPEERIIPGYAERYRKKKKK